MLLTLISVIGLIVGLGSLATTQLVPPEIISIVTGFGSGLAVLWIGKDYVKSRDTSYLTVLAEHSKSITNNTSQLERLNHTIMELRKDITKSTKSSGQA